MNQESIDKMILLLWVWYSIRFLFFSYWDILLSLPIIILLHGLQKNNNIHLGNQSGDWDPKAKSYHAQEDTKLKEQKKLSTSLDILIQKMIQDELQRIEKKLAANSK
ncbi:hypothetical protein TNCV_1141561 [Trichonephila clavipes]|nr:hypothetical protein TNCV_1141561 [Trichonephila clavipes]